MTRRKERYNVNIVKEMREKAHMTQWQLAKAVLVGRTTISAIETGQNMPSIDTARAIGAALNFPWYKIFEQVGKRLIGGAVLYTVKEVAALLHTNTDYVHKLRKNGLLPFIKLGSYKCRAQALEAFLAAYEGYDLTDPERPKELATKV